MVTARYCTFLQQFNFHAPTLAGSTPAISNQKTIDRFPSSYLFLPKYGTSLSSTVSRYSRDSLYPTVVY
eukprot:scaffold558_cov111-Cylindrotheca_fusiformis.AAC.11